MIMAGKRLAKAGTGPARRTDSQAHDEGTYHHLRACGRANETGSTDRAADISEPVSAAGRALGHYGPDAPGGGRRTPRPGLRRPGDGQETGQPLTAPRHRLGSVPARPA